MAVEVIDARKVRFEHKDLQVIVRSPMADRLLDAFAVEQGHVGVLFQDGNYVETLPPGKYACWKNMAKVLLVPVNLRETMLDIGGQETCAAFTCRLPSCTGRSTGCPSNWKTTPRRRSTGRFRSSWFWRSRRTPTSWNASIHHWSRWQRRWPKSSWPCGQSSSPVYEWANSFLIKVRRWAVEDTKDDII